MKKPEFDQNNQLSIRPSSTSSCNDFDFFVGRWNIHNKKLRRRLDNCNEWDEFDATQEMQTILGGMGNIDFFQTKQGSKPFEAMTLRLFNPVTRLWSIYWADNNVVVLDKPVLGSFENRIGFFYTEDVFHGMPILVVFKWDARDENNPTWSQAFSGDQGKTWEWNWFMCCTRR